MCTAILPSSTSTSTSNHTNARPSYPLIDALSTAHAAQRARLIVQYCRNGDFHNALMVAFADPHVQLNQRDSDGETPIGWAAYHGNVEMVKWLISKGANVNARTNTGWSPLMNATSRHHTSIVSLLLRAQASLDHTTQHGNTCLHLAADKGMDEICKMLLEAGAPVNVRNVYGDTPLMLACWSGHLECVQLLLASAAELEWVTIKKHRSALNIACHMNHTKIIEYLVAFGASVELANVGYTSHTTCSNSIAIESGRKLASTKEHRTKMILIEYGIVRDCASMVNDYLYAPIPIINVDQHKHTMVSDSLDFERYLYDVNRWNGPSGHQQLFRELSPFLNHSGTTYDVDKFRALISIPQNPQSDWKQHWRDIKEAMEYDVAFDVNICAVQFLFQE